jgi:hypothetical protein
MAKRYIEYEWLLEAINEGLSQYKPAGTMGTHHCVISLHPEGIRVKGTVRIKARKRHLGQYEYVPGTIILKPGDTLGYNCGRIWRLKAPETPLDFLREKWRMAVAVGLPEELVKIDNETGGTGNSTYYKGALASYTLIYDDGKGGFATLSDAEREIEWTTRYEEVLDYKKLTTRTAAEEAQIPNPDALVGILEVINDYDSFRTHPRRIIRTLEIRDRSKQVYGIINKWAASELAKMETGA